MILLALAAAPFWEARPAREWSEAELRKLTEDSPWAVIAEVARGSGAPGLQVYLASATPMRAAEAEIARRRKIPSDILREEYEEFLRQDGGRSVVLAIYIANPQALAAGEESREMQAESVMKIGRRKVKMTGHFPPTSSDPFLRLVFPREPMGKEKTLEFELYIPGVPGPYRLADFRVKDLVYHGQPDY
jgi:hypothetical protein